VKVSARRHSWLYVNAAVSAGRGCSVSRETAASQQAGEPGKKQARCRSGTHYQLSIVDLNRSLRGNTTAHHSTTGNTSLHMSMMLPLRTHMSTHWTHKHGQALNRSQLATSGQHAALFVRISPSWGQGPQEVSNPKLGSRVQVN
jgi:hypothetical protein